MGILVRLHSFISVVSVNEQELYAMTVQPRLYCGCNMFAVRIALHTGKLLFVFKQVCIRRLLRLGIVDIN